MGRRKPIIEDVLDKVRCPQFGYNDYGEWGALRFDQRLEIKELCDYAKSLEEYYEEHERKSKNMNSEKFMIIAKDMVKRYEIENDSDTIVKCGKPEPYIVWFCYELGHMKALLSTQLPNNMYYEITYNSAKSQIYFDAYTKVENKSYNVTVE